MRVCRKFRDSLGVIASVKGGIGLWVQLICNLVYFYRGGLAYDCARSLSFHELLMLNKEADRINREIMKEANAKRV